ncbi:MAG: AMP-binding protein, partial [Acidobacteria bacterium]|nr:AMP-binding protein [Acidobacteriota bacterium]
GVTTLWLTSGLFHLMADERPEDLRPLKQLLAGGDVLSPEPVRKVLELEDGPRLINGYGPTENTTFTCCHGMNSAAELPMGGGAIPIGRPISGTTVQIVSPDLELLPAGALGEL